jgi:hypothetical protein
VCTTTALPNVVGYLDWRLQNVVSTDNRMSGIYDWDSVALVPEPAPGVVGRGAHISPKRSCGRHLMTAVSRLEVRSPPVVTRHLAAAIRRCAAARHPEPFGA